MKAGWVAVVLFGSCVCLAAPVDRQEAWRLLNQRDFAPLDDSFNTAQRTYEDNAPRSTDAERTLSRTFRVFYSADESTGPLYDAWVKAYPRSYAASLARGEYLTALAWKRRGSDFARSISPAQWEAMDKVATLAKAELRRSLALTAKPVLTYEFLIELDMMTSGGNAAALLAEARRLDPEAYYASRAYLTGLRPQWGGSLADMRAFVARYRKAGGTGWKVDCLEAQVLDIDASDQVTPNPADRLTAMNRAIDLCPQASRYDARAYYHHQQKQDALAEKDYREALRLDSGDQWARASLGMQLVDVGNAEEGIALCRAAAAQQEPNAFQCLAYAYKFGKGVSKDPADVVRWLERSAASGNRSGMNDLAGYYWRGEGVPENKNRAVELWRMSAAKGYVPAREKLKELGFAE